MPAKINRLLAALPFPLPRLTLLPSHRIAGSEADRRIHPTTPQPSTDLPPWPRHAARFYCCWLPLSQWSPSPAPAIRRATSALKLTGSSWARCGGLEGDAEQGARGAQMRLRPALRRRVRRPRCAPDPSASGLAPASGRAGGGPECHPSRLQRAVLPLRCVCLCVCLCVCVRVCAGRQCLEPMLRIPRHRKQLPLPARIITTTQWCRGEPL